MANPFTRGTAPDRAQPDCLRTGDFKPGHKKRGGRKRGSPNLFSTEHKSAILEAAHRIGYDGNGKDGFRGYIRWVAERDLGFFYTSLWVGLLPLEEAEGSAPGQPHPMEDTNQMFRDFIGHTDQKRAVCQATQDNSPPVGWTGQPSPVGDLMQLAVVNPKAFCRLIIAGLLRPPAKRRLRGIEQRAIDGG